MQLSGLSPFKQDDVEVKSYELMDFDTLITRQQFNESRFKSDAVSPAGAISIAQITKQTFKEGIKNGYIPKDTKFEDLAKDDALAEQFQRAYMEDLMSRSWNKGSDIVKQAKALAAYNMGPTRLVNILNEMKEDGIDIYSDDMLWVEKLPEYHKNKKGEDIIESMDYVQNIMLGGEEIYEIKYKQLYEERFPGEENVKEEKNTAEKTGKQVKDKVPGVNPSSRLHIADRLKEKYNCQPAEFTPDCKPKLDDSVLSQLEYPEAKILCEHFLLDKRIAQLATGTQAWLKHEKNNKIHGTCNTNSTVTARASHSFPNMAQVPSVSVPFGKECRSLFTVPNGKKLVGIDISGLEVRMLAHFMSKYDNGEYTKVVLDGDIHTETQTLAGLDSRDLAKRFYYCFLYGGGVKRIAEVTGKKVGEASKIKKRFLNNLPALSKLIEQVQLAAERGHIVGLDKRQIKVRSAHAALNTLLQSAGALVCKQWLVEFDKLVKDIPETQQVVWVHDEIQVECLDKDAETVGRLAVKAIECTGKHFQLRLPLTGEYKIGNNWSETH